MSAIVKGFGCRPHQESAACTGGRRPKASKAGNRDGGMGGGAADAMWICVEQVRRVSCGQAIEDRNRRGFGA